jgi:hypothetical protein
MMRTAVLAASLVCIASSQSEDMSKEAPVDFNRKLYGEWKGGACMGELTLRADGTFERQHFSPGNNHLTGTWEVLREALPPTLVLTCKTSDRADLVGKRSEIKLVQLDDETLAYQYPGQQPARYTRVEKAKEKVP